MIRSAGHGRGWKAELPMCEKGVFIARADFLTDGVLLPPGSMGR